MLVVITLSVYSLRTMLCVACTSLSTNCFSYLYDSESDLKILQIVYKLYEKEREREKEKKNGVYIRTSA